MPSNGIYDTGCNPFLTHYITVKIFVKRFNPLRPNLSKIAEKYISRYF